MLFYKMSVLNEKRCKGECGVSILGKKRKYDDAFK